MKELIENIKKLWIYIKDDKKNLILIILGHILQIIISIILPILSAKILVEITSNEYIRVLVIAIILLFVDLINNTNSYVISNIFSKLYRNIMSKLEVKLGRSVLKIENDSLDKNSNGVFIQRMTGDTSDLANIFNDFISNISRFIEYIGILTAIFIVNKLIFIYVLFFAIILYLLEDIRTKKKKQDNKKFRESKEKVSGFIGELVRGARDIKMLNSEDDFINELSIIIRDCNEKMFSLQKRNNRYKILMWDISSLGNFILIFLLVLLLKNKILTSAVALVLYNYSGKVSSSAYFVGGFLEQIKDFNLSAERVFAIIDSDEFKKEKFGNIHLDKVNGDFEFKDVVFSYTNKKVLDKLNFKINANETVAFVGKSGAGKTTIFNLLCKMYDIDSGVITIDGVDIKKLDKDSIRGNITIISQNPYIFNMSIRDNLRLVKSSLTNDEMKNACKLACLDEYIDTLPDKYDTIIGEGGINLSGGQKQRLAIARALVQKTEIILFDEATSALDNETQEKIQKAINNMKNKYTILIIAHRLSTIINADRILFLDNGKIINEGSHDYLLKNCKEYRKLYEKEIKKENCK
ncbi:MAG: ABC transporter ATP-binding protein [Bacilli bacterium]|nr:ABC transporter ATP-binding protein [Bacilli bacterium]